MRFSAFIATFLFAASSSLTPLWAQNKPVQEINKNEGVGLPVDPATQRITYSGVVEVPGVTREQLFTRASTWIATAYYSSISAPQTIDKETGKIVVQGVTQAKTKGVIGSAANLGTVTHTLSIYLKEGRYKYEITNLRHQGSEGPTFNVLTGSSTGTATGGAFENEKPECGSLRMMGPTWRAIKRNTDEEVLEIIKKLTTAMNATTKDPSDF